MESAETIIFVFILLLCLALSIILSRLILLIRNLEDRIIAQAIDDNT